MDTIKLTVFIVEDNIDECRALEDYAEKFYDISVVGCTSSAEQAVKDIRRFRPHAVIIDIELHKGSGSGLDVIRKINSDADLKPRPYILVTTNNTSAVTHEYARLQGADYIMSKHQENYSEKVPIDFLIKMKNIILKNNSENIADGNETHEQYLKRIRRRIITELNQVGINPKNAGYQYLLDVISLTIENPSENAFQKIAEKRKKTYKSVMSSIENVIKKAWRTTSYDDLYRNYTANITSESGIPTVTEFIYFYANKIGNERIHE